MHQAAILFADLRGFTATTRTMSPHEVIRMTNTYMAVLVEAIEGEGGVVDKFIGDSVMAHFGIPAPGPVDPVIAAGRAAVRMQAGVRSLPEALGAEAPPKLGLGVGIAAGEVVAGNVGTESRTEYTVLGRVVNLASRLCARATPGQILVSAEAAQPLGPEFSLAPVEPMSLKGFDGPVQVFQVSSGA